MVTRICVYHYKKFGTHVQASLDYFGIVLFSDGLVHNWIHQLNDPSWAGAKLVCETIIGS